MRVASLASTLCAALALATSVRAANIDSGFTQDGVATYCQGLSTGAGPFPNLEANSLNRCPILVNITPASTTVHKNAPLEIKFKAQAKFGDIPGNIFPRAITDQNAKKVAGVTSAYIKYCKAGTNCDKVMDATPFGAEPPTGDFDASGAKTLPGYRITFPETGEYVVFGQVTLPGDAQLNVSGQQFVTFQKIKVVDAGAPIEPSPSPTPATPSASSTPAPSSSSAAPSPSSSAPSNGTSVGFDKLTNTTNTSDSVAADAAPVKSAVDSTPTPLSDAPASGASTKDGQEEDKGFFASHGALLGGVAGICVVVLVIGYAVAMRRKNKSTNDRKLDRGQTPTFRMSHNNEHMDDPEPVMYMSKKSARNSVNQHSLPILGGPASTSSTDDMPMAKAGSEMAPSFDDMGSYEEGTVTASNKAISTQVPRGAQDPHAGAHPSRPSSVASNDMVPSSLYDDRDTALYQGTTAKGSVRDSEDERGFYQSETWDAAATAHPYEAREESMISFNVETSSRRGFEAPSFTSESMEEYEEQNRVSRMNSEASVDSYAFRPSRTSVAESYQSRVSRYSYADSDFDRESSRISGMSLYSDRGTNV